MTDHKHTKINVLLIEDNPGDAKLIEEMFSSLQGNPFDLQWADSLRNGLAHLSKNKPDLVLLDLSLPDSHGIDTFIRIHEKMQEMPILILTGFDDEKMGIEAVRAGAQDFLNKGKITGESLERCIRFTIERKNVETKYRKGEGRLRKLIEQNADGMVLVDQQGAVVFANAAMRFFTGDDPGGLIGVPFGFPLLPGKTAEINFYNQQKGPLVAEMRVVELEWQGDTVYLASLRDITERKNAETALKNSQAQLVETEKIGALGTLVAGIAHELNNPMMGMLNYSQYCLKHVPEANKAFPVLEDMVRETQRCIDIVKNLLTFSRMEKSGGEKYEKVQCTILIDRVIHLLNYRIEKENISIKRSGEDKVPEIYVKVSNLQQVFLNLIGNALDALSGVKNKIIQIQSISEADVIHIDISDNGCGIEKGHLATIFDPFFTTKPPGRGTGLGLSVCRSIIKSHKGNISCKSTPGKGTTFRVTMPKRPETDRD